MKLSTITDSRGKLIAMLRGGCSGKVRVHIGTVDAGHHLHEIEIPDAARSLRPQEIHRRLKVPSPGQAPVYSPDI